MPTFFNKKCKNIYLKKPEIIRTLLTEEFKASNKMNGNGSRL